MHFSPCTVVFVDPTEEGIRAANTLKATGSGPTRMLNKDSNFDKNQEIINLEMRDFDNVEGIKDEFK
jgi:hypothetical protein